MLHTIAHIYGPFTIHSFGLFVVLGLIATIYLTLQHPLRAKIVTKNSFLDAILLSIIVGVVGCRILFIFQNWRTLQHYTDIFDVTSGGVSSLGAFVGILLVMPLYLRWHAIPCIPFFDLLAIHAALLHTFVRIGCFLSGCCHGIQTAMPWGVIYSDFESSAPLFVRIHPTQLYSACISLLLFFIIYFKLQYQFKKPGQITALYLMGTTMERFLVDFFRGDQEFLPYTSLLVLSTHQWIALGLFALGFILFIYASYATTKPYQYHEPV
ncbi:MAG TPA: prolipoprotein diacylglyceryl transferase [Candidatus Babeliales bacterium]|nr:prolipoprotein diacylglyceryl transferase [Candidatus Babeliales bacterium]